MNSDLLTNINLEDFYRYFCIEQADMAIASIPYTVNIPYAVFENNGNEITAFSEKPSYTYHSNAGIYIIRKQLFQLIPVQKHFNATDLIQISLDHKMKVVQFPFYGYWLDIGRHEDYRKAQEDIKHIRF
jgi:NDP-sugar pyrophosphorylase family protein